MKSIISISLCLLAVMSLFVFCGCPSLGGIPPNKDGVYVSPVYLHSFDDVFQATGENIERLGYFIDSVDKGTATYVFRPDMKPSWIAIVKIEPVSSSGGPQTRLNFRYQKSPSGFQWDQRHIFPEGFFESLQKVLATYR